jgi:hypothetical protein
MRSVPGPALGLGPLGPGGASLDLEGRARVLDVLGQPVDLLAAQVSLTRARMIFTFSAFGGSV